MLEFPMNHFGKEQPQEFHNPSTHEGIYQKFQDSSFLPTNNFEHLQQENGNEISVNFIRTIKHRGNEYSIVTPVKEPSAFGITYIALRNHSEKNKQTQYLPVENMDILIPVHRKNIKQSEIDQEKAENEILSRVFRNLEHEIPLKQALQHLKICNSTLDEPSSPQSNL